MNLRQWIIRFRKLDHFHINPDLFPQETKTVIPIADIKRFQALPLGTKAGAYLNIGLVDPYRLDARDALTLLARQTGKRVHFYEISEADYSTILKSIYQS